MKQNHHRPEWKEVFQQAPVPDQKDAIMDQLRFIEPDEAPEKAKRPVSGPMRGCMRRLCGHAGLCFSPFASSGICRGIVRCQPQHRIILGCRGKRYGSSRSQ